MIRNALFLAEQVDGLECSTSIPTKAHIRETASVGSALEKAISDLRHAADELDAERLSCHGWKQV
jgi:hypothetical protein